MIIYLTLDGLLDPLGRSQIVSYVVPQVKQGLRFHFMSFEKKSRLYGPKVADLKRQLKLVGCEWSYVIFHGRKSFVKGALSYLRFIIMVFRVLGSGRADVVHCRSFPVCFVAVFLRLFFKFKIVLDTRGLWFRERVEASMVRGLSFSCRYYLAKKVEDFLIARSSHVIFQTNAGARLALKDSPKNNTKVSIINNTADFDRFGLVDEQLRIELKANLGINPEDVCVGYSGSLGFWYLIDEMLLFFELFRERFTKSSFLILTNDDPTVLIDKCSRIDPTLLDRLVIVSAMDNDLGGLTSIFDVSVCFIRPLSSKRASSPTKVGESLASGVPVIANKHIGDLEQQFSQINCGWIVGDFSRPSLSHLVQRVRVLDSDERKVLRERSFQLFSSKVAADLYFSVHHSLCNNLD